MFEWDERKRLSNLAKHGIDFHRVTAMWDGPALVLPGRMVRGEQRLIGCGYVLNRIIAVIYTQRDGNRRIISARRARGHQKEAFQDYAGHR